MDNQQALLDQALQLFSQRGYDAVGVREVAEAVGVTKPTLYHYFDSKHGLLVALLQREAGRLLQHLLPASLYQGDLVLTLENITRAYFSNARTNSRSYRMLLAMEFAPPDSEVSLAIQPYVAEQQDLLENVFIQAAHDHGNLSGRHHRYAAGFRGEINAMVGLYFIQALELDDLVIYQTVHQFMHGIFS